MVVGESIRIVTREYLAGRVFGRTWRLGVCTMHWNLLARKKKLFRTPHQISVHFLKNSTLIIHISLLFEFCIEIINVLKFLYTLINIFLLFLIMFFHDHNQDETSLNSKRQIYFSV